MNYRVTRESDLYGSECFWYGTEYAARKGYARLLAKAEKLADGIERHYELCLVLDADCRKGGTELIRRAL